MRIPSIGPQLAFVFLTSLYYPSGTISQGKRGSNLVSSGYRIGGALPT
jgi:hypothetical protein